MPLATPHLCFSSVSFLSSLSPSASPHLLPLLRAQCMRARLDAIQCQNSNGFSQDENTFGRRDVLVGFNAATVMIGTSYIQPVHAADLTQRIQRGNFLSKIMDKLKIAMKGNPDLVPYFMRLALNDTATYDKSSKTGGANGSIQFSSELRRPENEGLAVAVDLLKGVKMEIDSESKGGPLAWSDLIQFAGQAATKRTFLNAAIKKCGGNEEKGIRLYTVYGSNGQWGLFDKQFGRTDAQEPDPEGRVLLWDQSPVSEIKAKFEQWGLKARQLAALSAFLGPDQLVTEAKLASDPEIAPWIEKYQRSRETVSQTDYEVDLITVFTKLSTLGQMINYEAYTYPPKPIKLKL
eukprot:c29603_g1_i1 orf=680-1726(+)